MKNRRGRAYSHPVRLATLAVFERNRGNLYRTEKETGIHSKTIQRWYEDALAKGEIEGLPERSELMNEVEIDQSVPLNKQLEQIASLMIQAMPERLSDANLHELARSLAIVVQTMQQTPDEREEEEAAGEVYERVSKVLDRYRAARRAAGLSEPAGGEDR